MISLELTLQEAEALLHYASEAYSSDRSYYLETDTEISEGEARLMKSYERASDVLADAVQDYRRKERAGG